MRLTTKVCFQFPELSPDRPWYRDSQKVHSILLLLNYCSPKSYERLRKLYPYLDELPKRPNSQVLIDEANIRHYSPVGSENYKTLLEIIPELRDICTRLILAGVEWY